MSAAEIGTPTAPPRCEVEFCGERFVADEDDIFLIGREGPLGLDDNPYLHRRFLEIRTEGGWWWIHNVGARLAATVSTSGGVAHAWLPPGGRLPLAFASTVVVFTAGPTTYEVTVLTDLPAFRPLLPEVQEVGATTIGTVPLTDSQRALIVALSEPMLTHVGTTPVALPSSAEAAARLGWPMTRFNRKLDNVCDKLDRAGVSGLRGDVGRLATHRRARLVEYAVTSRLVTPADLGLLHDVTGGAR